MTVFKSGDLVVLKSGGPVMTVDTVNTDIFDDSKITGVLCAWFDGTRLERVRFDHNAIEPAQAEKAVAAPAPSPVSSVEYKAVLDDMADAMNLPADAEKPAAAAPRKTKRAKAAKTDDVAAVSGVSRTH
jgi:uncharacterized protein YodC (DUF2158 family)